MDNAGGNLNLIRFKRKFCCSRDEDFCSFFTERFFVFLKRQKMRKREKWGEKLFKITSQLPTDKRIAMF